MDDDVGAPTFVRRGMDDVATLGDLESRVAGVDHDANHSGPAGLDPDQTRPGADLDRGGLADRELAIDHRSIVLFTELPGARS